MLHRLVSHNQDLQRLVGKGYALSVDDGHLIVRDIPYLDSERNLQWGALVAKLVFKDKDHVTQQDHQVYFAGGVPFNLDGTSIANLGGRPKTLALSELNSDVVVQRSFSNKPVPAGVFADFFEKIESYVTIISGPAMEAHDASPLTFRSVEDMPDSVFTFHDTLSSRAEINDLSQKLAHDVIAIIGLGGTGGYVLDFLAKTPVKEIRGFDNDRYHVHNAFRSPGMLVEGDLDDYKSHVYQRRYEGFRKGLSLTRQSIDSDSSHLLEGVTFAFVCVDKGASRAEVFKLLTGMKIPFIDVGMGLDRKQGPICGMIRTTFCDAGTDTHQRGFAPLADGANDVYRANIQISELNALNAAFAVLRYKQLRGFYYDEVFQINTLFDLRDSMMVGVPAQE